MPERKTFSTNDLMITSITDQHRFPLNDDGSEFYSERVWFGKDNFANVRMALENGSLRWVDNIVICLDKGIEFYYDHKYWGSPFGIGFQPPELKASYPAVIDFQSASENADGSITREVRYGSFWYDENGQLKAVNCGHLTQSEFAFNVPFVNLFRLDQGRWQIYRMRDIFEHTHDYYLNGKNKVPEDQLLHNDLEIVIDEIVTSITDNGEVVKLHQRTLPGHKQKTITVPSRIDLTGWAEDLTKVDGEWTKAFSDFPSQIELVI